MAADQMLKDKFAGRIAGTKMGGQVLTGTRLARRLQARGRAVAAAQIAVQGWVAANANAHDAHFELVERARRFQAVQTRMPAQLGSTYQPSYASKTTFAQSFGGGYLAERSIHLVYGSIETRGRSATISISEKHGQDTSQITAFLQTSFQFGGKVRGSRYALVGLIPAVLRALPGSVTVSP